MKLSSRAMALAAFGMAIPRVLRASSGAPSAAAEALEIPQSFEVAENGRLLESAAAGGVELKLVTRNGRRLHVPAQLDGLPARGRLRLTCQAPGAARLVEARPIEGAPAGAAMEVVQQEGQFEINDSRRPVFRYNYAAVDRPDLRPRIAAGNQKYALARSNYIHPLHGLEGEELTRDWPLDHPHHRGIYWAWPEVRWRGQLGDLHALQKVWARPTGKWAATSGPVFGQIAAENLWHWEDGTAILRECTVLRAYRRTVSGRVLDFSFQFEALNDPVTVARRNQSLYGGLNLRFRPVTGQEIRKQGNWAHLGGTFEDSPSPTGVLLLQHPQNPGFPMDWVDYPEINWLQPAFPRQNEAFEVRRGAPLRLKYRIVIHSSARLSDAEADSWWKSTGGPASPLEHLTPL